MHGRRVILGHVYFNLHKYSSSSDRGFSLYLLVNVHLKFVIVVELGHISGQPEEHIKDYDAHIIFKQKGTKISNL